MTDVDVRIARRRRAARVRRVAGAGLRDPGRPPRAWAEQMLATGRTERLLGAYRDGRLVGMLNVLAFGQWFGSRRCRWAESRRSSWSRSAGSESRRACWRRRSSSWPSGEVISTLGPGDVVGVPQVRAGSTAASTASRPCAPPSLPRSRPGLPVSGAPWPATATRSSRPTTAAASRPGSSPDRRGCGTSA